MVAADQSEHADPVSQHRQTFRRNVALSRPPAGQLGLGDLRSLAPHPIDRATPRSRRHAVVARHRRLLQFPQSDAAEARAGRFSAQITGRKRFQTKERAAMQTVEFFEGRFRFNPLGRLVAGRSGRLYGQARSAAPSAGGGRLSFHRLHALHAPRPGRRRLSRRPLVAVSKRTNAASMSKSAGGRRGHLEFMFTGSLR